MMSHNSTSTWFCLLCQAPTDPLPHPILGGPICTHCLRQRSYDAANKRYVGTSDGFPMFSVEFEVCSCESYRKVDQALILLKHGYLRTNDCSVLDEYKSPRYRGLTAFQEVLPTLESLKDLVDRCCGTHIHIDCPIQSLVDTHHGPLFSPLDGYLSAHQKETEQFWGRWSHYGLLIRTKTRYETLEFRLPRFRSAGQYLAVAQFCRQIGNTLNMRLNKDHPSYTPLPLSQIGAEVLELYQQRLSADMPGERSEVRV
ncbi:MAG TPA: hypothetical protein VH593_28890 [Ktedonobacteraceae bacterium]